MIVTSYAAAVFYYSSHYFDGTNINGIDCSGCTIKETLKKLSLSSDKSLKLIKKDGTIKSIPGKSFSLSISSEDDLNSIMDSQNQFLWFIEPDNGPDYTLDVKTEYDKESLLKIVDSLEPEFWGNEKSQNATIEKNQNGFFIKREIIGNIIDKEQLVVAIDTNLNNGNLEVNLVDNDCYKMPDIISTNENLQESLDRISALEDVVITYDFKDRQETLDKSKIMNWVEIDNAGNIFLNESDISLYVNQLAYKYDTYQKERRFKTAAGEEITVSGGIYGWEIHKEKEATALKEIILAGQSVTREPIYYIEGFERAEDDIGDTYIEVNLTTQHLWYFKDGQLFLESDVVSGYPYNGNSTPTGIFCVWSREKGRQLVGETYNTYVDYWMPINWDGVGLHDAWWQTAFGGTIYQTKYGSHGCINLPTDIAATIYDNVKIGTPVVIY